MKKKDSIRVAIVSDALTNRGGAEKTVLELLKIYPDATIYTSIVDKAIVKELFPNTRVVKSFINYIPFEKKIRQLLYLLYPWAFRSFSFLGYDVVISVTSAFGKYIKPWSSKTKHIMNCMTPPKFFWMKDGRAYKDVTRIDYRFYSFFMDTVLEKIWQYWDRKAARRADRVVAISETVKERIKKFYDLDSEIIYPPVEVSEIKLNSGSRQNWFLYVGRVERYKGVHLAIAACAKLKVPLKILGVGSLMDDMKDLVTELDAKGLVKFLGFGNDQQKYELLANCKALLSPIKDEDFGIVPVEANAAGAPVIAHRSGGAIENISENNPKTGLFFNEWNALSLAEAIEKFDEHDFNPHNCRKQAEQFSSTLFRYKFKNLVNDVLNSKKNS